MKIQQPAGQPVPVNDTGDAGMMGNSVVWTIVGVLAILALLVWLIPHLG